MTIGADKRMGIALVTGAGRRLGRAIAIGLAEAGYDIAVHYNGSSEGALDTVSCIENLGRKAVALQCDLGATETVGDLVRQAAATLGPLNVLVNSASIFDRDNLKNLSHEGWTRVINLNMTAPVFLMQAFSQQQHLPDDGAIVNILDTQMASAYPERFSYFCAKFGIDGATRLASTALAEKGITVNAIAPGLILPSGTQNHEDFIQRQKLMPLGEGLGAKDIVEGIKYLIRARHVTGHTLVVDGGERLMGMGNIYDHSTDN